MNSVNWTKVLSKCSPSVRKTLIHARATNEELRRQVLEQAAVTPKLDFSVYRNGGVAAGVVAEAEGKVKGFSVAKRDVSAELKALDAERDQKVNRKLNTFYLSMASRWPSLRNSWRAWN